MFFFLVVNYLITHESCHPLQEISRNPTIICFCINSLYGGGKAASSGSPGDALLLLTLTNFLCRAFAFQLLGLSLIHPYRVLTILIQHGFLVAFAVHVHLSFCNAWRFRKSVILAVGALKKSHLTKTNVTVICCFRHLPICLLLDFLCWHHRCNLLHISHDVVCFLILAQGLFQTG